MMADMGEWSAFPLYVYIISSSAHFFAWCMGEESIGRRGQYI